MQDERKTGRKLIAPFCWQNKRALRLIRQRMDAEGTVSSSIALYVALTEYDSDQNSPGVFTVTYAELAMRSGLSTRTVQDRTRDLVSIGLIRYETGALNIVRRRNIE